MGYSPWGRRESDRPEQLHFDFSLVAVSRGCSPRQCPCFALQGFLLLWSTGSGACRLQELQHTGLRAQAQ